MFKKTVFFIILCTFTLQGCELYKQDEYQEYYVVEAFLTAGDELPDVRVSRTVQITGTYSFDEAAITGAEVRIHLLDAAGGIEATYSYSETDRRGIYSPAATDDVVITAERQYKLEVTGLDQPGDRVTSVTFVPREFTIENLNVTSTVYQSEVQFEFNLTRSFYPGRQNVFVASAIALRPDIYSLTPFWANLDGEPDQYVQVSSGLINEGNYTVNPDDTIDLKYPWIGVAYYGPNELHIYAVDDNIYDYYRSLQIQQGGGGTLSPGQIENVLWNVEGGIGLFGARSGVSVEVFVEE